MDLNQQGFNLESRAQSRRSESPMFVAQGSVSSYSPEPQDGNQGINIGGNEHLEITGTDHDVIVFEEDEHESQAVQDNEDQCAEVDMPGDRSSSEDHDETGNTEENSEPEEADDDNEQGSGLTLSVPLGNQQCGNRDCIALKRRVKVQDMMLESKQRTIEAKTTRIKSLIAAKDRLRRQIIALEARLNNNGDSRGRRAQNNAPAPNNFQGHGGRRTWHSLLRASISASDPHHNWERTWKTCYQEENMPTNLNQTHPNIRLVEPRPGQGPQADETLDSASFRQPPCVEANRPLAVFKRSFDALPDKVLYKVLTELLVVNGLVHFLCRLDPFVPLDSFPDARSLAPNSNGLKARLFFSYNDHVQPVTQFNLTNDTIAPGKFLAALAVNRKWHWYGVGIFFGVNTFATSSFGELDSFGTGMGVARVQRIQHLEIHWVGGKYPRLDNDDHKADRPRRGPCFDRRSLPLAWLDEMPRLRTLVVWIDETSKRVIRRPFEPEHIKRYMKEQTSGQPNARMTRALRASRGWDHLHQLRGLDYVRLYDTAKMAVKMNRGKAKVRDRSAVLDLNRTARMKKVPSRAKDARLTRLYPLFSRRLDAWRPDKKDFALLRHVYKHCFPFDLRKNDLDIDTTHRRGTPSVVSVSDDEDGVGDCSSDESESGSDGSESDSSRLNNHTRGLPSPPSSTGKSLSLRGATLDPDFGKETLDEDDEVAEVVEAQDQDTDADGTDTVGDSADSGDENSSDESSDDESSDDESSNGRYGDGHDNRLGETENDTYKVELQMRRSRSDQFGRNHPNTGSDIQLQRGHQDGDCAHLMPQASRDRQAPIQIDTDDDEVQIIPPPPSGTLDMPQSWSRSRFILDNAQRRSESSEGLFVTPGPEERSTVKSEEATSATASASASTSPAPSIHVDLTLLDDSEEEDEAESTSSRQQKGQHKDGQLSFSPRGYADMDDQMPEMAPCEIVRLSSDEDDRDDDDDDDNDDSQIPGRFLTASPQPHGIKRTRDGSVAASDPDESRKKRLLTCQFGPHNDWSQDF